MKEVRLKEIAELIMGQSPPGKSYNKEGNGVQLLNGAADFDKQGIHPIQYTTDPKRNCKKGDILLCIRATIGNLVFSDKEYCLGRGVAAIRITKDDINPKYILYITEGKLIELVNRAEGSTIKGIKKTDLENLSYKIPSIKIQNKIVTILEKVEDLNSIREEANEETNSLIQSIFFNMFSKKVYPMVTIKSVTQKTSNKNPEDDPDAYFDYIDISSINNKIGKIIQTKKKLGKNAPSRARRKVQKGDIIVSTVRPNLNAVAIVPDEFNNEICSTGFCVIRCSKEILPDYLFPITRSKRFVRYLISKMKGASYPAVTNSDILSYKIPLPPIEKQEKFRSIIKKINKNMTENLMQHEELQNLFDSLLQKSFRGELTT